MQDCQEGPPIEQALQSTASLPLYDQLSELKDWKEEMAELCHPEDVRQEGCY